MSFICVVEEDIERHSDYIVFLIMSGDPMSISRATHLSIGKFDLDSSSRAHVHSTQQQAIDPIRLVLGESVINLITRPTGQSVSVLLVDCSLILVADVSSRSLI